MKDIWGRPLKIGDLVMNDLRYYIVISDIELFIPDYIVKYNDGKVYLIDNPIEQEKLLYEDYTLKYQKYLLKRMEKDKKKKEELKRNKSKSELIRPGDILKEKNSPNGTHYLYLGEGVYKDFDGISREGHLYLKCSNNILEYNNKDFSELDLEKNYQLYNFYTQTLHDSISIKSVPRSLNPLHNNLIKSFKNKSNQIITKVGHINMGDECEELILYKSYSYFDNTNAKYVWESNYIEDKCPFKIKLFK